MANHKIYVVEERNHYWHKNGALDCLALYYATTFEHALRLMKMYCADQPGRDVNLHWWMAIYSQTLDTDDPDIQFLGSFDKCGNPIPGGYSLEGYRSGKRIIETDSDELNVCGCAKRVQVIEVMN